LLLILTILLTYCDFDPQTQKTLTDKVTIDAKGGGSEVVTEGADFSRTTRYDAHGLLQELSEEKKGETLHIARQSDQITITATRHGETKTKTHKGVKEPWIQELYFGLKTFTLSRQPKLKYVSINPDDLSLVPMVLTRKEVETIDGHRAQKLHMTVDGWKSRFWEAWSWTDPETGLLIQKKGNRGPLTPTIITKIQKNLSN
jgi:hypothetical protein